MKNEDLSLEGVRKVLREDVEQYVIMCRQNPEANLLPKIFTSTQGNATTYERIRTAPDGFREWLIDFMCGYGWRIVKKSERHLAIMGKYFRGR